VWPPIGARGSGTRRSSCNEGSLGWEATRRRMGDANIACLTESRLRKQVGFSKAIAGKNTMTGADGCPRCVNDEARPTRRAVLKSQKRGQRQKYCTSARSWTLDVSQARSSTSDEVGKRDKRQSQRAGLLVLDCRLHLAGCFSSIEGTGTGPCPAAARLPTLSPGVARGRCACPCWTLSHPCAANLRC